MKNIMIVMVIALLCYANVKAQSISADKVPSVVKEAFKSKFPNAQNTAWELERKDVYEVNFINGKNKQAAQFDKAGKWEKTELEIETSQLPKPVSESLNKSYPGYKITECEKIETTKYKEAYELDIVKGATKTEVQLLPNGEIIKK